ncbi:MAG: glycosyltransferase family 39 protein [Dehalogenimonas sp.]|uniref:Glycosyltransferase family 39 protein n=1 Tax=Candidatus Dehalogenimonas loeffleri TaxID=3127115 RepID=A0ABZ2J1B2_9CHLR|nr:glycosyltransferase family 39 protein [Dehalogenimonas sp.]
MKSIYYFYGGLMVLVGLFLAAHFAVVASPTTPFFDEKYYIVDARHIIAGDGTDRIEHPPLGKLIISSGILIFGDNPFGWRIMPVLFGAASIVLLYLICRRLNLGGRAAFFVTFLFALENLSFVQSGIAMLDVFSVTFMLASFYLYLRGNWLSSGVFIGLAGLAGLAKLTGFLALPIIALHWLLTNRRKVRRFALSLAAAPAAYLAVLPLLDWVIWGKFINPVTETKTMLDVLSASTFANLPSEMLSRPWEWLTQIELITYWPEPHYLAMLSPTLLLLWLPAAIYTVAKLRDKAPWALFAAVWFAGTYLLWIPATLITDRISYIFYLYPAVPAIALFTGCALLALESRLLRDRLVWRVKVGRWLITVVALIHLGLFIYLSPLPYWGKLVFGLAFYVLLRYYLNRADNEPLNTEVLT